MSKCVIIPRPDFPTLPSSLTFAFPIPLPSVELEANLCCISVSVTAFLDIPPLPPLTLNLAFLAPIEEALEELEELVNELPINCPMNPIGD